jgi:hypothetical protein
LEEAKYPYTPVSKSSFFKVRRDGCFTVVLGEVEAVKHTVVLSRLHTKPRHSITKMLKVKQYLKQPTKNTLQKN